MYPYIFLSSLLCFYASETIRRWHACRLAKVVNSKASELVPGSLFPRWNSMWNYGRRSLYDSTSLALERFSTLYRQSSKHVMNLELVRYYVVIGSRMCQCCEISKKLTLNPTLSAKNTPLILLSDTRRSLQIFTWGMPLHAHVFSFTHNTVLLSDFRCVHLKNQKKFFDFNIFMNQNKRLLHKAWIDS